MNAPLANPHLMRAGYGKVLSPRFTKAYCGHVGHGTRRWFKRATEALRYAERVVIRYRRLYDAAIVELAAGSETHAEQVTA